MLVQASKRWKILDVFLVGGAFGTLALGFWLYARYGFSPLAGITNGSVEPHKDFDVFLHSARALWEGGDVYSENGGPSISTNPPFWTVLVVPLALLKPDYSLSGIRPARCTGGRELHGLESRRTGAAACLIHLRSVAAYFL